MGKLCSLKDKKMVKKIIKVGRKNVKIYSF